MARILVNLLSFTGTKGGMETYARELYTELGAMQTGHEFIGFGSTEFMKRDHAWFPGTVHNSGFSGENRFAWAFAELFMVSRAARKLHVDLIHNPMTLGPWRSHVPAVYTMHDMLYFRAPELMATPSYTRPMQWLEKRGASNATAIITDSHDAAADVERYLTFPKDRIEVVYLAARPPEQQPEQVERERALFLAVGNRLPHKNFAGLVRAIGRIPAHRRPTLVVTGSRGNDPLRQIVEELDLGASVDLRSWVSDEELAWLYQHATALVIANFCDGFGLPVLEAQQLGTPVLLSDIEVYHEVAGDSVGYFDTTDPEAIASTMLRAVDSPNWLKELTLKGYLHAADFTWRRTAEQTLIVLEQALVEPSRAKSRRRTR